MVSNSHLRALFSALSLLAGALHAQTAAGPARPSETTIVFDAAVGDPRTGWIDHWNAGIAGGEHYIGHLGSVQWGAEFATLSHDYRGNVWFDTWGAFPKNVSVKRVEFLYAHDISYTSGVPVDWSSDLWVSSRGWGIGDGTESPSAYYSSGGALGAREEWDEGVTTKWIELPGACDEIDSDIYGTVVQLRDRSAAPYSGQWAAVVDASRCKLRITYE